MIFVLLNLVQWGDFFSLQMFSMFPVTKSLSFHHGFGELGSNSEAQSQQLLLSQHFCLFFLLYFLMVISILTALLQKHCEFSSEMLNSIISMNINQIHSK